MARIFSETPNFKETLYFLACMRKLENETP